MSTPKKQSFHILRFAAENFMKLSAVEITPEGNLITLTGENGAGKSAVLNAIASAVGGADERPKKPLRTGAEKGRVLVETPEYIVLWKFTKAGDNLTVESKLTGAIQPSPQTLLNKMRGDLTFDPLAFSRDKPADQKAILQKLVGLDFTAKDAESDRVYVERTANNKLLAAAKGELALCLWDATAPAKETPMAELLAELDVIEKHNAGVAEKQNELDDHRIDAAKANEAFTKANNALKLLEEQLKAAKALAKSCQANHEASKAKYAEMSEEVKKLVLHDPSAVKERMQTLEASNALVRKNARHTELRSKVERIEKASEDMSERLIAIEKEKADELAKVKFPLPGLSFDKDGVLLDGEPFAQASTGEKIRASTAIGMALNPTLRIMFCRDASNLDAKGLELMKTMAMDNEFQIWLEDNRSTEKTAIRIEDGHLASEESAA